MKRDYETPKLEKMMLYFKDVIASSGLIEESEGEGDSGDFNDLFG